MSDEYEHQLYWLTFNTRLNEEEKAILSEPICLEKNEKGDCLQSVKFVMIDQNNINPPFCETIKNKK